MEKREEWTRISVDLPPTVHKALLDLVKDKLTSISKEGAKAIVQRLVEKKKLKEGRYL